MKKKLILAFAKLYLLLSVARLLRWKGLQRRALAGFSATLKQVPGVDLSMETMRIRIGFNLLKRKLRLRAEMKNTVIENLPVTREKVQFSQLACDLYCSVTRNSVLIHDNSTLTYNDVGCNIGLQYIKPGRSISVRITGHQLAAADLLRSFPHFSCRHLYAMNYDGHLSFEVSAGYCPGNMDKEHLSLLFNTAGLVISNKAGSVFDRLQDPFVHHVYEKGKIVRSIDLSCSNPDFIPFSKIPELLYKVIVHTEDPHFFFHKGIDQSFIGYSLLQNIQQRRIVRGGSTITMQLARNLYLGHNRSIFRKLEEIVIAWLLETAFEVPKTRMLEIYLNIIEFAPGIYGIKEACRYYFGKSPAELSVTECLVLSYIIPRPKHFDEALKCSSAQLRINLKKHIDRVSNALRSRGTITQQEFETIDLVFPLCGKTLSLADAPLS